MNRLAILRAHMYHNKLLYEIESSAYSSSTDNEANSSVMHGINNLALIASLELAGSTVFTFASHNFSVHKGAVCSQAFKRPDKYRTHTDFDTFVTVDS